MTTGVSVRVLASPGFVLALVVFVLNDHVLKTAYPGWITGKLSDFAGLVVAPVLLGVLLTAWRVARPMPLAITLTGVGFALAKTSAAGAAVTSAAWSLTGVPTLIRADVTDLLALPALGLGWAIHRQVSRQTPPEWRRLVAVATGTALLPVAVLATAATDCYVGDGLSSITVVSGSFRGGVPGPEQRIALEPYAIDGSGVVSEVRYDERFPSEGEQWQVDAACDDDGSCWRIDHDAPVPAVQVSTDGGRRWFRDLWVTPDERNEALVGAPSGCGHAPSAELQDLVVLKDGTSVRVVVAASDAGMYVRTVGGRWSRIPVDELFERSTRHERVRGLLSVVQPRTPPHQPPIPLPGETPSLPPEPSCDEPVTVSATPNPQNGPPTVYTYCP